MPTYHRSQRLRLVGTGPKVEQLQEGRFRLTFTCTATNPNEAWMNGNKDQIITAYGTLQSAQKNIAGIDPRTDEAYSDMVLFRTEANPSERDLIITLVYETATETFVKSQDDRIDFELNGLQRVTRVTIAKTGTTLPSVTIGTTEITVDGTACKLASRSVEENDAFIQITETYLESGITDVREDIIGSQKAIVITKVGSEPTVSEAASKSDISYDGSSDWSIARKDVSQEGGLKIYNYTFLLDNTVLSQSQDKQGSLKTEVIEVFNPRVTIDGLTVEGGSTVAGNYFLYTVQSNGRNQYFQSQGDFYPKTISYNGTSWRLTQFNGVYATSTDTNPDNEEDPPSTGWSGTENNEVTQITIREFDQTLPNSTIGFELSHRYDKEGYSLINIQRSNLDGIPTMRYTFAKDNSIISVSEDKVGSQNAIVNEIFNPVSESITGVDSDNVALSGYSEIDRTESNYEGIKTIRVRFLKDDTVLSQSTDNKSPLLTEVLEVFNPVSSRETKSNYVLVNKQESNVDGIPTERYTFDRSGVILSESFDLVGSQKSVVISKFASEPNLADAALFSGESGYVIAKKEEVGPFGKETYTYTFLKEDVTLSTSEDKVGSQLAIVKEVFNGTPSTPTGYVLASEEESNVDGIPTRRFRFLKDNVILSVSEDLVGSQKAVIIEKFGSEEPELDDDDEIAGINLDNHELARKDKSNFEGIKTFRYTYLRSSIISVAQDFVGDINTIQVTAFNKTEASVKSDLSEVTNNHKLISQRENDHDGIKTTTFTFEINTSDIIQFTADDRLQVTRTIYEAHDYNYDSNYTVGTSTATVNNTLLTLTSLRVDQRGTTGSFTKLTAVYTQPKIVTVSPIMTSQYNDVPVYQYRSIVSSAKAINDVLVAADPSSRIDDPNGTDLQANAVFFEPSINNNTSPSTFTQNVLNTSTDLSVADSSVLISSHDDLYNFLYPGVVSLNSRFYGRTSGGRYARIDIKTIKESYPTTTKVRCNVYNFIQRNGDIEDTDFTYDGASGLWSANSWATVDANITKSYFSIDPEPNFTSNVYTGYRMNGSSIRGTLQRISLIAGSYNTNLFYNGVNYGTEYNGYFYEVKITEPGPPDPVGRKWCLGVDIKPVFRDTSGNTYYNKQIIVTERIPIKQRGQVTYN